MDILSIVAFALATVATPGPNNFMVLASGAQFGYRRSLPHMFGIALGFPVMLVAVVLGLGAVFEGYPDIHRALKLVALAYLLWLAYRIAFADAPRGRGAVGRPLSFLGAAAFQWVNPKAWALALGAAPIFTTVGGNHRVEIALVAAIFAIVTLPSISIWCLFGSGIARWLGDPMRRRAFNMAMAVLLVASVIPMLV